LKDSFFSWNNHGFIPDRKHLFDIESLNNELREKVSALSVDNENLQELLEQQRNMCLAAENECRKYSKECHTQMLEQFCSEENNSLKEKHELEMQEKALEELKKVCSRLEGKNNNLQIFCMLLCLMNFLFHSMLKFCHNTF